MSLNEIILSLIRGYCFRLGTTIPMRWTVTVIDEFLMNYYENLIYYHYNKSKIFICELFLTEQTRIYIYRD